MDFIDCPFCHMKHPLLNDEEGHIFFCKGREKNKEGKWLLRLKNGEMIEKKMEDRTTLKW